jgi:hypothetical protein
MQKTILYSNIGNVAHFYGDASTNYYTTINLLCSYRLVSDRLVAARLVSARLRYVTH